MKVHKMAEIMADAGRCFICKDEDGVRWYGDGGAMYPAHGWPELTEAQVKEMFCVEEPPFGWRGQELKEVEFPQIKDMSRRYTYYADKLDVTIKTDNGDDAVPAKTPKGIMFIKQKYIDAVDTERRNDIRLRCMTDKRNRPVFVAEDGDGKKYAVIMPVTIRKAQAKVFRDMGFRRFLISSADKGILARRVKKAIELLREGKRMGGVIYGDRMERIRRTEQ